MFLCCCPSKVNQEQPENGDPDLEQNKQGRLIFNGNYESRDIIIIIGINFTVK